MKRISFNENWTVRENAIDFVGVVFDKGDSGRKVTLPYDAMIHERKTPDTKNKNNTGFYPGKCYTFSKKFFAPGEWENRTVLLEFEGVYGAAMVYLNGDFAGKQLYGYSNFYIAAGDFLKYGEENEICVVANNSAEQNSRWYSGSGIYRNVKLIVADRLHIAVDGVRLTTPDVDGDMATVVVDVALENLSGFRRRVSLDVELRDPSGRVAARDSAPVTMYSGASERVRRRMSVLRPALWGPDSPSLYTCAVRLVEDGAEADAEEFRFGIRSLRLDVEHGLRINGETVKLRGACIHHDNGVIGACTLEAAELRRCRQLKAAGFNCIRSAHHPIGKAMLDACDEVGMLVMDELTDIWNEPKNPNDFGQYFSDCWERELGRMVDKDFNHPSVILYSTGNEIQEAGSEKGAQLNRAISNLFRTLDPTRYTTNGINGILAARNDIRTIMDEFYELQGSKPPAAGPDEEFDAISAMNSLVSGPLAEFYSAHPIMSARVDEYASALDVAGYNYMTVRHELERGQRPNRVVLGAETFPAEIVRLWDIVRRNAHVIGDMTWTGYDYLGEAGCGIFKYDGSVNFASRWPDTLAYIGDIDLIGYRRPISYLREIVFGLRCDPYIAVDRLNRYGLTPSTTPWMHRDCIASWTWHGYEGKPAVVRVFSDGEEVELLLGGASLGRKPVQAFEAVFETVYAPGELLAVSYRGGAETGRCALATAGEEVQLSVEADRTALAADGADLAFITVSLRDARGSGNLQAVRSVTVSVEGAGTLQGFGSAEPQTDRSYDDTTWETYDGYVLAVVRAGFDKGDITVSFSADGCETRTVTLTVG